MLTAALMAAMDNGHLIAAIHAEADPLTTTPIETELLRRLEGCVADKAHGLASAIDEYGFTAVDLRTLGDAVILDADNTAELLSALGDAGIDTAAALTAELVLAKKFRALANDAGEVLERLSQLATTATKE